MDAVTPPLHPQRPAPPLDILADTPDYVAVLKPAGLATIPGRGESDSVLERLGVGALQLEDR